MMKMRQWEVVVADWLQTVKNNYIPIYIDTNSLPPAPRTCPDWRQLPIIGVLVSSLLLLI